MANYLHFWRGLLVPSFFMRSFLFFLFFASPVSAQEVDSIAYLNMKSIVEYLASDSLCGRASGSVEEKIAANFIRSSMRTSGCKVKRQKFNFMFDSRSYVSQNVIGFINNHKDSTLLITAHYDHLGTGEYKSMSTSIAIHNGADDNASGVALMLQLANDLPASIKAYNLLFVAYSGHELGLYGSQYFSQHLCSRYGEIALALNFDMVGRMDERSNCYFEATESVKTTTLTSHLENVKWVSSSKERLSLLDSKWFLSKGVPSMTISTGIHLDYHKPTDDVQYINWRGMEKIRRDLLSWLRENYN